VGKTLLLLLLAGADLPRSSMLSHSNECCSDENESLRDGDLDVDKSPTTPTEYLTAFSTCTTCRRKSASTHFFFLAYYEINK
jgi:hypothetical protein